MNIDFLHNQIIRDTVTNGFIESFNDQLVPQLLAEYGSVITEIQFYEDHLASDLRINGEFFYPLTVVAGERVFTKWIKWLVSNYRNYDKFNPFSYKGAQPLEFTLLSEVSPEIEAKVKGKARYSNAKSMPVILSAASDEKTFLAGKFSQKFVDLLAERLTKRIEKEFSICELADSGVVLEIRFEPATYMEHRLASTTYRRISIKARACAPRDFWIKWTKLDGNGAYTVSDEVDPDNIEFDIAEDTPGGIKEKEYRYLASVSVDKYQSAMGRKNITAWREMIRRVIKRGEVAVLPAGIVFAEDSLTISAPAAKIEAVNTVDEAVSSDVSFEQEVNELISKSKQEIERPMRAKYNEDEELASLLGDLGIALDEPDTDDEEEEDINGDLTDLLKTLIGVSDAPETQEDDAEDAVSVAEQEKIAEDSEPEITEEPEDVADLLMGIINEVEEAEKTIDEISENYNEEADTQIPVSVDSNKTQDDVDSTEETEFIAQEEQTIEEAISIEDYEKLIREELERKIRAEMEAKLLEKEKEAEELRNILEEKRRAEEREREEIAEAARAAIAAQQEAARLADEARIAEEQRLEEARRLAEEAVAEEESFFEEDEELEEEPESEYIEQDDIEEESEEEEIFTPEPEEHTAPVEEPVKYISKSVKLIFKRSIDANSITKKIHEIIVATIKYFHKEDVYIKLKATIPDSTTVNLDFVKIPENEVQLVVNIIKVLGRSDLGIIKAILD